MSYIAGILTDHANIQESLEDAFLNTPMVDTAQKVPFLEWLYSPLNRGGLEVQVNPGRGKVRTAEVIYMQELNDNAVESDVENPTCATGDLHPDNFQTYTIDTTENRSAKFTVTRADLEKAWHENDDYVSRVILKLMYTIERAVASKSAAEAVTLSGTWSDDVADAYTVTNDQLVLETLQAGSNYDLSPFALQELTSAVEMTGYTAAPFVFGGTVMRDYTLRMIAGGSADHGTDLGLMYERYGIGAAYDYYLRQALGDNTESLVMQPGAAQLLTYTASEWRDGMPFVREGSNYAQVRLVTPRVGLPVDLIVTDDCGTITFRVVATTKCVGLPADMFNANNQFDGVTLINQVKITNT